MNKHNILWISGKEYFRLIIRPSVVAILLFGHFLLGVSIIIAFLSGILYQFHFMFMVAIILGALLFSLSVLWFFSWKEGKVPRVFLECGWCRSICSPVICKEIERFLKENKIRYLFEGTFRYYYDGKQILYNISKINTDLTNIKKGKKYHFAQVHEKLYLVDYNILISFWKGGDTSLPFRLPNYISVEQIGDQDKCPKDFIHILKKDIKKIILKMPKENEFCKRCNGSRRSTCYGENRKEFTMWDKYATQRVCELAEMIDPYKDEKIFEKLIRRKERLNGMYHSETFENEYNEFIDDELLRIINKR